MVGGNVRLSETWGPLPTLLALVILSFGVCCWYRIMNELLLIRLRPINDHQVLILRILAQVIQRIMRPFKDLNGIKIIHLQNTFQDLNRRQRTIMV